MVKAEEYANGLPSKFYDFGLGEHEIKSSLQGWIDNTIHNICKEKDKLKAEKKILKAYELREKKRRSKKKQIIMI